MSEENRLHAGDILEDRQGNKMVIIEAEEKSDHIECLVLVNGRVKRVSSRSPWIIKSYKESQKRRIENG